MYLRPGNADAGHRSDRQPGSLNTFLAGVFLQMALSVALSGAAAFGVLHIASLRRLLAAPTGLTPLGWLVLLSPLGLVIAMGARLARLPALAARALLLLYAVLVGLSVGETLIGLSDASLFGTFLATVAAFAALATIGFLTGRSLSGIGSFLTMTLTGFVVALLVNLFVQSQSFDLGIAAIGFLLFAGLTAYDTQRLKDLHDDHSRSGGGAASLGALVLYLDFLNLFLSMLRFTGRRR